MAAAAPLTVTAATSLLAFMPTSPCASAG
jgi:hypothetical protein